jgi:hypothetical protein
MNRDFEFKQLLRAYRAGIISEQAFEEEMAGLERGAGTNGSATAGFQAFGKTYSSERDAIVSFIDKIRAAETNAGIAFANWAKVCATDCIRSGLRMIAERESYHGRIFEQRIRDLGGECQAAVSEESRNFMACASDAKMPDNEKLLQIAKLVSDPEAATRPIREFADLLKEDLETKEALKLFYEDELSSTKWLLYACAALNAPAQSASASASA